MKNYYLTFYKQILCPTKIVSFSVFLLMAIVTNCVNHKSLIISNLPILFLTVYLDNLPKVSCVVLG